MKVPIGIITLILVFVLTLTHGIGIIGEQDSAQEQAQTSQNNSFRGGLNYLSAGNRFSQNDSITKPDFEFFEANNISSLSIRIVWASWANYSIDWNGLSVHENVKTNYHRLLNLTDDLSLKVQFDFWTSYKRGGSWTMPNEISPWDIIRNLTVRGQWFTFVSEVMNEFKSHDSIESWTLMNEPYARALGDEELFYECWTLQEGLMRDIDPVRLFSIRFSLGDSPWSGDFDKTKVFQFCDYIAINEYLDPSNSSYTRWGANWTMFGECVLECKNSHKPLVISEFGNNSTKDEDNRVWYEQTLDIFKSSGIQKAYAYAWQRVEPEEEGFNIAPNSTLLPPENAKPAFFELASASTPLTQSNAYLVVRGLDNLIYYRMFNSTSSVWGDWEDLVGSTCDSPAAVICEDELHIVVRGSDGESLWHGCLTDPADTESFSGWTCISGATDSAPTLTSNGTVLCLVVRGLDDRIYHRCYSEGSWGSWHAVPTGATLDSPTATLLRNNLHIVVRGMDGNSLWHTIARSDGSVARDWMWLSGATGSRPALTSHQQLYRLYLSVRGLDNGIYYREYDALLDSWASWNGLPGATIDGPAIMLNDSSLHPVVRGSDGDTLWHGYLSYPANAGSFTGWTAISGATPSAPTITS